MHDINLSDEQLGRWDDDGFLMIENFLEPYEVEAARSRFPLLFRGEFETGLFPDEWNWKEGRDADDLARQICNGWKSDYTIARFVLSAEVGRLCAQLSRWPGARINQDNVIWKPPTARPLGMHQDEAYSFWMDPPHMTSAWIALDETRAGAGTIEYVRGSHKWGDFGPIKQFHAPENYRKAVDTAAAEIGVMPEFVPVELPPGGIAFHHGMTFHGSDTNRSGSTVRRAMIAHTMSSDCRFTETGVSYIYNRYKRVGDTAMDESFFPILWTENNYRTPWLDDYVRKGSAEGLAA